MGGGAGGTGAGGAGGAANCVVAIQNAGYAFPPADPCSACKDNGISLQTKCEGMIDCLASMWPCTGNCHTQCLNTVGGSGVLDACVSALTTASCGN
jgi:hypothetical protein